MATSGGQSVIMQFNVALLHAHALDLSDYGSTFGGKYYQLSLIHSERDINFSEGRRS